MSSWNSGSGPASEPPPHRGALTGRCGGGACAEDAFLPQSCLLLSVGGRRRRRQEPGRLGSAPLGLPHRSQCHGLASDAAPGEALRLRPLQGHGSASQPHHARQAAGWHLGGTLLGPPDSIVDLGCTEVSEDLFLEYLSSLGESIFRGESYNLFDHNCNTFSNEVAQFLTGRKIPSYITDLPSEVLATPFGQALRPLLDSIQIQPPGGNTFSRHNGQS